MLVPVKNSFGVGGHTGPIYLHQLGDKHLELLEPESGQRSSLGTHDKSLAVAVWTEQTQFAVVSPVHLHALEAFRSIVQAAGGRGNAEILVWFDFWGLPSIVHGPSDGDHVVCTVRVTEFLRRTGFRNQTQVGGPSYLDGRGIKLSYCLSNGTHVWLGVMIADMVQKLDPVYDKGAKLSDN